MRVKSLLQHLSACQVNGVSTFDKLPVGAQVRVLNSRLWSILGNGLTFWKARLDDEDASTELRKRAAAEVNLRNRSVESMLPFVVSAAHYNDGGITTEIEYDAGSRDEFGDDRPLTEHSNTAVTGHPHAWCMAGISQQFGAHLFEGVEPSTSSKIFIHDPEATYRKAAAQYAATVLLIEAGHYNPPRNERAATRLADMAFTAACSTTLKSVMDSPKPLRGLVDLFKSFDNFPFSVTQYMKGQDTPVTTLYDSADLVRILHEIEEMDEDDRLAAEAKAEAQDHKKHLRDVRDQILAVTRKAETCTVVTTAVTTGVAALKAAGMSDAAIGAIYGPIMADLMGVPATPATVAAVAAPTAPADTSLSDTEFEASLARAEAQQKVEDEVAAKAAEAEARLTAAKAAKAARIEELKQAVMSDNALAIATAKASKKKGAKQTA